MDSKGTVIYIDDSDVVKPDCRKFEALGIVRDASMSTDAKNVYGKGCHITEACVLTGNNHPVSIFSRVHSSQEKNFTSANDITFSSMERDTALFGKATFVMDRGYDDNKMFLKLEELGQDYVIRLTEKRKLCLHGKWIPATQLREQRKGKIKPPLFTKGKPMTLATNREIRSKEDVVKATKLYFSRWRMEEYFRCKKQVFHFENFRVRKLRAINALNLCITLCMAFPVQLSMKGETNALRVSVLLKADAIKEKVPFCYYRLAKGIRGILAFAREGVRLWFRTKRPAYRQLSLRLII